MKSSVDGSGGGGDAKVTTAAAAAAATAVEPTSSTAAASAAFAKKRGRLPKKQKGGGGMQDDCWKGHQMQSIDEIAASSYAPHMGIFLGHRVVKMFPQDRENYLGTVVAYHVPWAPALESSVSSDGDDGDDGEEDSSKGSEEDAYNDLMASSFRLWKGDHDVGADGDAHAQSGSTKGIAKREKREKKSATAESVESKSIRACRQELRFGAIPGLYRVLFDDGDVEDIDPTDVYRYALKYHKMREARIKYPHRKHAPVNGVAHVDGIPKSRAAQSKRSGERELRRHANPPLRATVGRGSGALAKAQVLDIERMAYWMAYEEYFPGQARWTPLVGSLDLMEWSELGDSGKESSTTAVGRSASALGGSAKAKPKRDGPRKPERRRMAVPPAPSSSPAHAAGDSASKMGVVDDEAKQKKMRSSIVPEERDTSMPSTSLGDGGSSYSSVSSKVGDSIASFGEAQDSTPPPKSTPPVTTHTQDVRAKKGPEPSRIDNSGWKQQEVEGSSKKEVTSQASGAAAATGTEAEKKTSPPKKTPRRSSGGAASVAESESLPGEAHGLPKSSDAWLLPQSKHIPLSHSSAVKHKPPPKHFKLKIPDYQRLLTIPNESPGEPPHVLVLSVTASTIPNGGRGLYCTYRGPNAHWKVSDYVDLGCYGPHTANDIKPDYIMEIKNFLYFDHPSEWSFDAPGGITSSEAKEGLTIHGKAIVKDMLYDITDDATGEVHEMAEKTLLPFVNEVTVDGKRLKQKQNVDSNHHDNGSLHYLLRKGFKLKRNKTAELFVYYGSHYDANRNRKHSAYVDRKEVKNSPASNGDDESDTSENGGSSSDSDYSDNEHRRKRAKVDKAAEKSKAMVDDDDDNLPVDPDVGPIVVDKAGMELSASGHPVQLIKCPDCKKRNDKLCVKSTLSVSSYTNIRKSMFTYSESDVITVLDLFLRSPPIEPKSRERMSWVVKQLRLYMTQVLYQKRMGRIPARINAKLSRALDLFPRPEGDPYRMADLRAKAKYQYLGTVIRKEVGASGFRTGFVEHIVKRRAVGSGNDDDGNLDDELEEDYDDMFSAAPKEYLVLFYSHEEEQAVVTESEIMQNSLRSTFGFIG
mmetsp:Transcript_31826/g.93480  ORF Transcript_31826/g.93480 Transcript_31826/m.93480 type:complete len:1091 (+) Transcript_31826:287-3559(+)|eukprot:CAMPEP_0181060438 /NCGR_PEP_ID=MMETSP1070-20121207/21960_1 /TAXON_ID=265543 /ORGANISM="Minutocellus polymorphus, Strain NH13" /LENGTH=1090 /DNA_ID=CAMNT_0023140271 /DNA_START=210 /DNA_END=3482 /DNA_ORIENTATION=+